jgi:hypothetical protein
VITNLKPVKADNKNVEDFLKRYREEEKLQGV